MTTTKTTPKCWVNPYPIRREESETPQMDAALFGCFGETSCSVIYEQGVIDE